jgi:predicted amidohydrolase YtcJ
LNIHSNSRRWFTFAISLACLLLTLTSTRAAEPTRLADTIYRNGTIITMDARSRNVEAVAVQGEEIVLAGTLAEVNKLVSPKTTIVDLQGRAMLPGFYAAHDHFLNGSVSAMYQLDLNSPPIGNITGIEEIVAALRERAANTPPGKWVVGRGYDDTLVREKRHPTRNDLDRASTNHPIWIVHTSGHLGVANSRALALGGVTKDTPQPKGGVIQKDARSGEPNGVFEESSGLITRLLPARSQAERLDAVRQANRPYLAKGVTTTVIAGGSRQSVDDLKLAVERNLVDLRMVSMLTGTAVPASVGDAVKLGGPPERLRVGAVKLGQDGSIQGYTGYLTLPYHLQPAGKENYRGYALRSRAELVEMVKKHHRAGYQIAIHGNGDAAIDDILFAYAEAQRESPRPDARHRIEHCQTPREDQLDRMKQLGVSPSFFVGHVYYWGDRHRDIFLGPERAARISPLHSAAQRGLRFTVHSDTPVTPVDPLLLVWAAVNRLTREGKVLGPNERLGVLEAFRTVTIDAAWQNFEEHRKGSIEAGKFADFVILAENPLTLKPEYLKDIAVVETIVGGKSVFRR